MTDTRRRFLVRAAAGGAAVAGAWHLWDEQAWRRMPGANVFVGRAPSYREDIRSVVQAGLKELGVTEREVRGLRILLKPNLVEPWSDKPHVNTDVRVVRAVAEAFVALAASEVWVGEAPGHRRDTWLVFESSGYMSGLKGVPVNLVDLNEGKMVTVKNAGGQTRFREFTFSALLRHVDWVVSVAKMKTHHWAGVTLSMKNLFGALPGHVYGWPKNALHYAGIPASILDITATLRPALAVVDGIVGMEGDGPIMGDPREAGVVVMGRNPAAVDATCARLMGVDPLRVEHLRRAEQLVGPVRESKIQQVGGDLISNSLQFRLIDSIPAQKSIRL